MRSEARALEALLEVLSQRIHRQPLRADDDLAASDAARRRGDRQARRDHARVRQQQRETDAPRRGARPRRRSARNDIAVLLEDLPRAEQTARAVADQLRAVGSELADEGRSLRAAGQRARRAHARAPTSSSPRRPTGSPARLAEIEARERARGSARRRSRAGLFGHARRAARPDLGNARADPLRDRRPGGRGRRAGRPGLGGNRQGRRRRRRIARGQHRPCEQLARRRCPAGSPSRTAPRSG